MYYHYFIFCRWGNRERERGYLTCWGHTVNKGNSESFPHDLLNEWIYLENSWGRVPLSSDKPRSKLQLSNSLAVSLDKLLKPSRASVSLSVKWANNIYLVWLCWRSEINACKRTYCCAWCSNLFIGMLHCYSVNSFVLGARKTAASTIPAPKPLIVQWSNIDRKNLHPVGRAMLSHTG